MSQNSAPNSANISSAVTIADCKNVLITRLASSALTSSGSLVHLLVTGGANINVAEASFLGTQVEQPLDDNLNAVLVGGALFKDVSNVSIGTIKSFGHSYVGAASNNGDDASIQHGAFGLAISGVNGLDIKSGLDISNVQSNGDFASGYLIQGGSQKHQDEWPQGQQHQQHRFTGFAVQEQWY